MKMATLYEAPCEVDALHTLSHLILAPFFLITQMRKLRLREVKSLALEYIQIFCSFHSLLSPQDTRPLLCSLHPGLTPMERCPSRTSRPIASYPLGQETLSAHFTVSFPPSKTGEQNAY